MADTGQLEEDFLGHLWPPFTQLAGLKPTIMERAEGALVYDTEGNAYIDAFASLWTVNVGHGRKEIFDAIAAQAEKLAIYHIFQIGNVPSIQLAAKVAEHLPGDLDHIFLTLGGGESVETAVKMARQYWRNKGQGTKYMVMYRDRSYHGTTMTATSAQGLPMNRAEALGMRGAHAIGGMAAFIPSRRDAAVNETDTVHLTRAGEKGGRGTG